MDEPSKRKEPPERKERPEKSRRIDDTDGSPTLASTSNNQLAVYGLETMTKLSASNVLISGMQGLGVEIAKNIILAGVKSVTLHDENKVELWDLSSSFVYSEVDIGRNRARASIHKLQELNNAVDVKPLTDKLTKEQLSAFQAVVFLDTSFEKAIEFDDYCHSHQPPIAFIKADVRGLFGSLFCDFGPQFTVLDVDGEEPHSGIITSVSNDNRALVSCDDDKSLEFQDGDLVVFSDVEGMAQLNDGKPRTINNVTPCSFVLEEDTTSFGKFVKGGIVTQFKQKVLDFKPLREAIKDPGDFLRSDFSKLDRPRLLHLAFQSLDSFSTQEGRFPSAGSVVDAQKLVDIATEINKNLGDAMLEDVNPTLLRHLAFGSRAVLNPMAAMFGGIVGLEVVKACSGKFHPIFQFFYFDSVESLPKEPLDASEFRPQNTRYDAQISVFGSTLQKKLENARVFVVGAGALGCEFLKNLALMGVSCGDQGKLTVTDDDVIEKSNLSHQFLFREWSIGRDKSSVAAAAAVGINSRLKIDALQNRVGPETENVFDDSFWENLTVVVNALDNVTARLYVDSRCVYFQKPLLESGTLGAKCNTQIVIPHLTESYGASIDPPEKQAPMCTVHSFPHNIDHCLTWARSEFECLFEKTPAEVNDYLSTPDEYMMAMRIAGNAQARDTLGRVAECLGAEKFCKTFNDCIDWARGRFEDYFVNRVKQLIFTFPEDANTSTGAPFWSAPKRFPRPLRFSSTDQSHTNFVIAAACLRAETFRIRTPSWVSEKRGLILGKLLKRVGVPKWKKDAKIVTDEKATTSVDDAVIDKLISHIEKLRKQNLSSGFSMKPITFEKDDDTNYHMDMIAGLANMRARNYRIPEVDKHKAKFIAAKFIAGRIIPAIATSTAMATGFVCLELYKVLDGAHKLEDYRNTFANLALPLFTIAKPVPVEVFDVSNFINTVSKIDPMRPIESGIYTSPPYEYDREIFCSELWLRIEIVPPYNYSKKVVLKFFRRHKIYPDPDLVVKSLEEGGYNVMFSSEDELKHALEYNGEMIEEVIESKPRKFDEAEGSRVFFTRIRGSLSTYLIYGLSKLARLTIENSNLEEILKSTFEPFGEELRIFIPSQQTTEYAFMYINDPVSKRISERNEATDYNVSVAGKIKRICVKLINPTVQLHSIMSQMYSLKN